MDCEFVLFDPVDVDWHRRVVRGWCPARATRPFGEWVRRTTGLPDAIYENVFVHLAVSGYSRSLRRHARKLGIPLFNPPLPNKWQMVRWMQRSDLARLAPATAYLHSGAQARKLVDKWALVYVKPIGGYGGMGVLRIERLHHDQYRVSVDRQKGGGGRRRMVLTEEQLERFLDGRRRVPHIVQRGIRLMTVDGRKVDFRVVVQRGADGAWQLVGIIPKVAAADGVVTNIVAGGERMSLSQLQAMAARHGHKVPVDDLTAAALQVARALSRRVPNVGLLGFDAGVDENGRTWIIEVNPKPARSLLSDDMRQQMAVHSAGFAAYLAKRHRQT